MSAVIVARRLNGLRNANVRISASVAVSHTQMQRTLLFVCVYRDEKEAGNLNGVVWTPTAPVLWEQSSTRHNDWAVAVNSREVLTSML